MEEEQRGEELYVVARNRRKILFIAASPDDMDIVKVNREWRSILRAVRLGTDRDLFAFLAPQLSVTVQDLIMAMDQKPEIVHFSGHGGSDRVIIEAQNGESRPLGRAAVKRLFRPLTNIVRLVLFNSCYSAELAEEISKLGMHVVGTNQPISDDAAVAFSSGLYLGLGQGKGFQEAFNDGMFSVIAEEPDCENVFEVWKDGEQVLL